MDFSTLSGATILAERIEKYWLDRGFVGIKCWAEKIRGISQDSGTPVFMVTSNIGPNGYPPAARVN